MNIEKMRREAIFLKEDGKSEIEIYRRLFAVIGLEDMVKSLQEMDKEA